MIERQKRKLIIPFLAPALLFYAVIFLYPSARSFYISLTDWRGGLTSSIQFIGFDNFRDLANDDIFRGTISNTARFTVMGAIVLFPLALFLAYATSERLVGARIFRFIILAPVALSVAAAALLWKFILNPNFGLLNGLLDTIGLDSFARPWLGDTTTAMPAVVLATVWHGVGIWMVFFAAAISRVPVELKEAARIDGASSLRVFRYVVFPLIWDVSRILLVLWIIGALQTFAFVYAMTQGGPFNSTNVFATYLYQVAFTESRWGYATAIAVAMFVLILVLAVVMNRLTRRETVEH